jgi:hypothetical protein
MNQRFVFSIMLFAGLFCMAEMDAQSKCPEVPKNYQWNTPESYRKDEEQVKKVLKWLTFAPLQIDLVTRSEANLFVLQWLSGTPDYMVDIDTEKLPFMASHPELLDSFIHGVALAYLNKGSEVDVLLAYSSGFQSVAQVALQSKMMSKSRTLKPLLRAASRQQVKAYTQKILAKSTTK